MPSLRERPQPFRRRDFSYRRRRSQHRLMHYAARRKPRRAHRWRPLLLFSGSVSPGVAKRVPTRLITACGTAPNTEAPAVCSVLNDYPTLPGVAGVIEGLVEDDEFTPYRTDEVVVLWVADGCPRHVPLLQRFDTYTPKGQVE